MINLSVPPALADRLHAVAKQRETDADTLLRHVLEAFLNCSPPLKSAHAS